MACTPGASPWHPQPFFVVFFFFVFFFFVFFVVFFFFFFFFFFITLDSGASRPLRLELSDPQVHAS